MSGSLRNYASGSLAYYEDAIDRFVEGIREDDGRCEAHVESSGTLGIRVKFRCGARRKTVKVVFDPESPRTRSIGEWRNLILRKAILLEGTESKLAAEDDARKIWRRQLVSAITISDDNVDAAPIADVILLHGKLSYVLLTGESFDNLGTLVAAFRNISSLKTFGVCFPMNGPILRYLDASVAVLRELRGGVPIKEKAYQLQCDGGDAEDDPFVRLRPEVGVGPLPRLKATFGIGSHRCFSYSRLKITINGLKGLSNDKDESFGTLFLSFSQDTSYGSVAASVAPFMTTVNDCIRPEVFALDQIYFPELMNGGYHQVTDDHAEAISSVIRGAEHMESLEIRGGNVSFTDRGWAMIASGARESAKLTSMRVIGVGACSPMALSAMVKEVGGSRLIKSVAFIECGVDDEGLTNIAKVLLAHSYCTVREEMLAIDLSRNSKITDKGGKELESLLIQYDLGVSSCVLGGTRVNSDCRQRI